VIGGRGGIHHKKHKGDKKHKARRNPFCVFSTFCDFCGESLLCHQLLRDSSLVATIMHKLEINPIAELVGYAIRNHRIEP
jgi:hypothetical protein